MLPKSRIYKHYDYFIAYERSDDLVQIGELRPLTSFADKRGCLRAYVELIDDMKQDGKIGWIGSVGIENGPMLKLMWRAGAFPFKTQDGQILFYKEIK